MKYFMILRTLTTSIFIIYGIYARKYLAKVKITQFCCSAEFSFSIKGKIHSISVGMEMFEMLNGIPM